MNEQKGPIGGGWDSAVSTDTVQSPQSTGGKPGNGAFVDQSESVVATIGSSYLQNYLTGGGVGKGIGILTQKRFYYKGRNFAGVGKEAKSTTEEGVVSIEDISFTKLSHTRHIGAIIRGVLCLLGLLVAKSMELEGNWAILIPLLILGALASFVQFFITRNTLFVVAFPGGNFAFDVHYYPISDIRDFQRQLHLLKDRIKGA